MSLKQSMQVSTATMRTGTTRHHQRHHKREGGEGAKALTGTNGTQDKLHILTQLVNKTRSPVEAHMRPQRVRSPGETTSQHWLDSNFAQITYLATLNPITHTTFLLLCVKGYTDSYLATWSIYSLLCSSNGMDCSHKSFLDSKIVIQDFSHRSQAVGCTRCIATRQNTTKSTFTVQLFCIDSIPFFVLR